MPQPDSLKADKENVLVKYAEDVRFGTGAKNLIDYINLKAEDTRFDGDDISYNQLRNCTNFEYISLQDFYIKIKVGGNTSLNEINSWKKQVEKQGLLLDKKKQFYLAHSNRTWHICYFKENNFIKQKIHEMSELADLYQYLSDMSMSHIVDSKVSILFDLIVPNLNLNIIRQNISGTCIPNPSFSDEWREVDLSKCKFNHAKFVGLDLFLINFSGCDFSYLTMCNIYRLNPLRLFEVKELNSVITKGDSSKFLEEIIGQICKLQEMFNTFRDNHLIDLSEFLKENILEKIQDFDNLIQQEKNNDCLKYELIKCVNDVKSKIKQLDEMNSDIESYCREKIYLEEIDQYLDENSDESRTKNLNQLLEVINIILGCNMADKFLQAAECYGLAKAYVKEWKETSTNKEIRNYYKTKIDTENFNMLKNFIHYTLRLPPNSQADTLKIRLKGYATSLWHLHQRPQQIANHQRPAQAWVEEKSKNLINLFHDILIFSLDMLEVSYSEVQNDFAVICLGSLATCMATGYSDIEYIILLGQECANMNLVKLDQLADLVELLVTSLGETPVYVAEAILRIAFKKTPDVKSWLKDIIHKGVRIDTVKKPQAHNYVIRLIGTVENYLSKKAQKLFKPGNHLASSLLSPVYVLGNEELFKNFKDGIKKLLINGSYRNFINSLWIHDNHEFRYNIIGELEKQKNKRDLSKKWSPKQLILHPLCILRNTYWSLMCNTNFNKQLTSNVWEMLDILSEELPKFLPEHANFITTSWQVMLREGLILRLETEMEYKRSDIEVTLQTLLEKHSTLITALSEFDEHLPDLVRYCSSAIWSNKSSQEMTRPTDAPTIGVRLI